MDMKRIRKQIFTTVHANLEKDNVPQNAEKKSGISMVRSNSMLVISLMTFAVLIMISIMYRYPTSGQTFKVTRLKIFKEKDAKGYEENFSSSTRVNARLLDGLLVDGFNDESCLSRYQSYLLRKRSSHQPSSYLLKRLRSYEALHRKCGPYTESYNKTIDRLKSNDSPDDADCKYIILIAYSGLGNRILTMASAFLYALLTERILLIDRGTDMNHLFCEPFLGSTWMLPLDFPINGLSSFDSNSPMRYGNMLKHNAVHSNSNGTMLHSPSFAYLHLAHDYDDHDKLFFCDEEQMHLREIPWLLMRTDNYFVPSLFLMEMFEPELAAIFPEKDTVFHHLGRYLFHPTNSVWGLIHRFYNSYLSLAEERIGIQIRVFEVGDGPFPHVLNQILACTMNEKLLPQLCHQESPSSKTHGKHKAVLITSLISGYFESIRNMYWEYSTVTGDIVSVYQPSHEEFQQTEKRMHNMKAWAEMYLLSLTDVLVTSSWSTFGYAAQGLGGLKPWILYKTENKTVPEPPCRRAMSMEPCFHAPPFYDCKAKKGIDTGKLVPYVRHCEDISWGLKLVHPERQ